MESILLNRGIKYYNRLKTWYFAADTLFCMKGAIKDLLNIPGVQGYILAEMNNIQIKLPAKFNTLSAKEHISKMHKDILNQKNKPCNIIEIFTSGMAVIVFCSATPILIVVTDNTAGIPIIRIKGKLVHADLVKEATG
jgi:hypothetical protein